MHVTLISPYHGGSHESWARGLKGHSRHDVELLTLPARFWKWRMHGGALTLARRFLDAGSRPDVIMATDMLDLSSFLAATRRLTASTPAVLYMHENQLTYPLPADPGQGAMRRQGGERDQHYAFINFASMLVADRVVFNSEFHRAAVLAELPRFLRRFPEHNELSGVATIEDKSSVLPVGIDCAFFGRTGSSAGTDETEGAASTLRAPADDATPLVIWNQRWEYDKNPGLFFGALQQVAACGIPFRLAVCGQAFHRRPGEIEAALEALGDRVVHCGLADPDVYRRLLAEATVTASTAEHEFFGVSILEAMASRTLAILPGRLSYPEILAASGLPAPQLDRCTYRTPEELVARLAWALENPGEASELAAELAAVAHRFDWPAVASQYDELIESLVATRV